jgi:hypothetical protein
MGWDGSGGKSNGGITGETNQAHGGEAMYSIGPYAPRHDDPVPRPDLHLRPGGCSCGAKTGDLLGWRLGFGSSSFCSSSSSNGSISSRT